MRKTGDHTGSPLPSYAAGTHHFSSGRTQFAPTVLTIITAVFTERLNYSNLIIGSVGNAVPGVPWDLMCFHGQPQGLSLRFFSICSGRCPHRPKVIYLIIRLRRIGLSRRRTIRIYRDFVRFQAANVGDGLPVPHYTDPFSWNAEDSVPYKNIIAFYRFGMTSRRWEQAPALPVR